MLCLLDELGDRTEIAIASRLGTFRSGPSMCLPLDRLGDRLPLDKLWGRLPLDELGDRLPLDRFGGRG